jgi:hypothetical protein
LQWTGNPWSNLESSKKKHGAGSSKSRHYKSSHQKETMHWCWKNGGNHGIYFQHECVLSHMHCNDSRGPTLVHQQRPFLGYPMFKRSKVVEVCWIKIPVSVEVVHPGDVSKPLSDEQNAAVRFHSMANGRPVWHGEWGWWIVFSFFHYLVVRIQRSYAVKWGAKELLRVS